LAFDVISIREKKSAPMQGMPVFGPTGDGYRAVNMQLFLALMTAYVPAAGGGSFFGNGQITGMPDWVMQERYDIVAKVGDADMAEWQKPAAQKLMLQAMLQSMFAERCKMVVHRETKETAVSFLVLGKSGPKFKETDPAETHAGVTMPFGGVMSPDPSGMKMYGVSMETLATFLTQMGGDGGRQIVDKTGLTGNYDVVMRMRERMEPGSDPGMMVPMMLDDLGLKLEPGKAVVEKLVIDHMERPSAN
jgi:uncharacterized protein (TIGR03435 family)